MSEPKFTPGPWVTYLQGDSTARIVATEARDAHGRRSEDVARIVTGEANAQLIAAAPELYGALGALIEAHRMVVHGEATHVPAHLLNAAEAALAKARGES